MAESDTTKDLLAGWVGGAVGIVISNPLEVLKVRLQTNPSPNQEHGPLNNSLIFSRSPSPIHHGHNTPAALALQYSIPPNCFPDYHSSYVENTRNLKSFNPGANSVVSGLKTLWRKEGYKFLFAGAAAPILGLAFIDSFFFAAYGKCMTSFDQDRERPNNLAYVFTSGAVAGGVCALLQTPIEVIKCRAQAERLNQETGFKSGSFAIAKRIYHHDGFRGFYLGGFMTGCRDSLSSGIFFTCYALIRNKLREFDSLDGLSLSSGNSSNASPQRSTEVVTNMAAGGFSGLISALLPYPLDIVKTRLQVTKVTSSYQATSPRYSSDQTLKKECKSRRTGPSLSIIPITRQIYTEGKNVILPNLHHTRFYRLCNVLVSVFDRLKGLQPTSHSSLLSQRRKILRISLRAGGLMGFYRGLKPTLLSSFVGSAITMGIFEFVFAFLSNSVD